METCLWVRDETGLTKAKLGRRNYPIVVNSPNQLFPTINRRWNCQAAFLMFIKERAQQTLCHSTSRLAGSHLAGRNQDRRIQLDNLEKVI